MKNDNRPEEIKNLPLKLEIGSEDIKSLIDGENYNFTVLAKLSVDFDKLIYVPKFFSFKCFKKEKFIGWVGLKANKVYISGIDAAISSDNWGHHGL